MNESYSTPLIAGRTKLGKTKFWQGLVETDEKNTVRFSQFWQEDDAGNETKTQTSARTKVLGKNIGKSNETSPFEQACLEIDSDYNLKVDKGYRSYSPGGPINDIKEISEKLSPMLAKHVDDISDKRAEEIDLPWPTNSNPQRAWIGQPKLDGFRAVRHNDFGEWSRNLKDFKNPEARAHIQIDTKGVYLDGELMMNLPDFQASGQDHIYQATSTLVNKFRSDALNQTLHYFIFDVLDPDQPEMTCIERLRLRDSLFSDIENPYVQLVPWVWLSSWEEVEAYETEQLLLGYEGIMLKDPESLYEVGARSYNTLKVKRFKDEEFKILNIIDGGGKKEGCAIFVCDNGHGKSFNADMIGTYELAAKIYQERDLWIGKEITIRHQPPMSRDLIPRLPKAKPVIRKDIEG